ncbi:hypothetical protein E4T56_gene5966 [Termitomyces sp. T112]|nr:hypothetical protein E4T56_gene5966 [Termitomyces sp. T112]
MPKLYHGQRQHIIVSLDALCYQLHTLSFIMSPSISSFLCRLLSQLQCSKPRDIDPTAAPSLRFFFANILLLNSSSIWSHATKGATEGRTIVLDFVGMGYVPSKMQLLGLDLLIIFLQFTLMTIVYEIYLYEHGSETNTPDMLLPIPTPPSPIPSSLFTPIPSSASSITTMAQHTKSSPPPITSPYVVDLRLSPIMIRLWNPPPPPQATASDVSLPLPNTTPWPLPAGMRMLLRASTRIRRDAGEGLTTDDTRIPGSLGSRDG